ncbi:MAG: ATP-binding protein [Rubrivivax sp.]|nr:ATP-binding protein [Rubrivivax sp.]MDP3222305.1 ATP-binding protein [Rubrivivax sp.]
MNKWRHSIKGRLLLLFVLLALGTTAVFLFGMQRLLHTGWQAYARPLVADYVDRLAAEIGSPPSAERARAISQRLPVAVRIEGPQVQLDTDEDKPRRRFGGDGSHRHRDPFDENSDASDWGLSRSTADGHQITFSLSAPPKSARPRIFGWATLGALLLMLTAAYASVWRLLRPLQAITAGVEAYGRGQFKVPIAVQRRDELGDLSQRINAMASSLQGMLDAKRALLLAMSHELRSPLTRARVNAELLDDSPERQALLRDMGEMRDLISTLLESERLANVGDGRDVHSALQAEATDLAQLARDTAATHEGPPVTLQLDNSIGPVSIDPTRVRLLLRNLLANARRHAPDASTPPTLYLQREADGQLALGLRDHGPGVPADVLPHLAEAFYRPDAARTRSSGGVGLGLHLCRLVAQAHGGQLRIRRADPGLDVAMVWAPLH